MFTVSEFLNVIFDLRRKTMFFRPRSFSNCQLTFFSSPKQIPLNVVVYVFFLFKSYYIYFEWHATGTLCLEEARATIRIAFDNPSTRNLRKANSDNLDSSRQVNKNYQPVNPHGEACRLEDWAVRKTAFAAIPVGAPGNTHVLTASFPGPPLRTWNVVALRLGKFGHEAAFVVNAQNQWVGFAPPSWKIDELRNKCTNAIAKHWRGTKHDTSQKDFLNALRKQPLYCRQICDLTVLSRCFLAACTGASGPTPSYLWDVIGVPRSIHTIFSDSDESDCENTNKTTTTTSSSTQESTAIQIGTEVEGCGWSDEEEVDHSCVTDFQSGGSGPADLYKENRDGDLLDPLNESQKGAVTTFLGRESHGKMQLLQGPPGSGKTHTIVALLRALVRNDCFLNGQRKVLVCATSNKAVQVVLESLIAVEPCAMVVLAGVEDKLQPSCRCFFLNTRARVLSEHLQSNDRLTILRHLKNFKDAAPATFAQLKLGRVFEAIDSEKSGKFEDVLKNARESVQELADQEFRGDAMALQTELLARASIVFCTVAASGRSALKRALKGKVEALVIDEAAQGPEGETIVPLAYQPQRVLLVGDPQQLATTVCQSRAAELAGWGRSMMGRLFAIDYPHSMLAVQYRMHPDISKFPANRFYTGLSDGPQTWTLSDQFPAYRLIDVKEGQEARNGGVSISNRAEADAIVNAARMLLLKTTTESSSNEGEEEERSIVVITFYAGQRALLRRLLPASIAVHTVDSFQGSEADVVLLSFVRANRQAKVGFLNDFRRLNVALTRAKRLLWVFCNGGMLTGGDDHLSALWQDGLDREAIWTLDDVNAINTNNAITNGKCNDNGPKRRRL